MKALLALVCLCVANLLLSCASRQTELETKLLQETTAETKAEAEKGDATAQFLLGYMYANGQGVAKDGAEAVKWYRKAADQGYAPAQAYLGDMYKYGQGVAKDEAQAVEWYRLAADQGDAKAQNNLGVMYANGEGVAKDEVEAYKWLLLAGAQGDEHARGTIPEIELNLSTEQRAEGQRLAREWKRKVP